MSDATDEKQLRVAIQSNEFFSRSEQSTGLVVFTHGLSSKPGDYEDLLVDLLTDEKAPLADCDLLPHRFSAGVAANTSFFGPDERDRARYEAVKLNGKIAELYRKRRYHKIYLVGHSLGGILVRATVLEGFEGVQATPSREDWVSQIDRLVLLASANRGVVIEKLHERIGYSILRLFRRARLLRDAMRGSEFMNNQRLGWILKFQRDERTPPKIVQLLGDADDTVSKYDSTDIERYPNSKQMILPGVGHAEFKGMNKDHKSYGHIRDAFSCDVETTVARPQADTKSLVFLIHGIRDFGEWQSTLARSIQEQNPGSTVISIRYGYFNIFQFLLGFQRSRAVRSFTDRYIEEIAKLQEPLNRVEVSVAAHSNGSYVIGNALKKYPYMVVNRIYLAGSVLPRSFEWHKLSTLQLENLKAIRNDCANWDWPVGILCSALRWMFLHKAIGVAGYRGFEKSEARPKIINSTYLKGGHGVAFQPHMHDNIARYLLTGQPQRPGSIDSPKFIMNVFHWGAPILLAAIIYGLYKLYSSVIPWIAETITILPSGPVQIFASAVLTVSLILVLARI